MGPRIAGHGRHGLVGRRWTRDPATPRRRITRGFHWLPILTGHYQIRGDEIYANELGADGECPAGGARAQDNHVVGVIGDGFRAEVDGDLLYLGKDDGSGLVYRAVE